MMIDTITSSYLCESKVIFNYWFAYINKESFPLVVNAQPVQILSGDTDYVDIFIHAYDNRGNIVSQNVRVYNKKSEIRGEWKGLFFYIVCVFICLASFIYIVFCIFDSCGN